jgi:hypothetical protein
MAIEEDVDLKIPLKAADAALLSSVTGGILATKETGTYVLKPFRSPKSKKLRTAVVFVPRLSHFDIENERSKNNEFRVRLSPSFTRATTQNIAFTISTYKLGIFHALLDLTFHMDSPHVHSKHRNTGRTPQPAVCDDVLKRCAHIGAQ